MLSIAACRACRRARAPLRCCAAAPAVGGLLVRAAVLTKCPLVGGCLVVRAVVWWFVCLSSLAVEFVCLRWSRSDVTFSTDGPAQVP